MVKVEQIEGQDAVYVVSDDANGENMALDEAVDMAAPHLHEEFTGTDYVDGELRWRVGRSDYGALLEVFDTLDGVNPEEVDEAVTLLETLVKEGQQ